MSWSRVLVFDPAGHILTELDVATVRSWVLSDVGRLTFEINVFDPTGAQTYALKTTPVNLNYGNLILVQHRASTSADGTTNGVLPDWCGVILPLQQWGPGTITVTAYSAEQILKYRPMPYVNLAGTADTQFVQLLAYANALGGLHISPGIIDSSSKIGPNALRGDALSETKNLVTQSGCEWDVTPQLDSNGTLTLLGNWYVRKGMATNQLLCNVNTEAASQIYMEQGEFYNQVIGYSDAHTDGTRSTATVTNFSSVAQNGLLAISKAFPGTQNAGADVISNMASAYLAQFSSPTRTFAPRILDVGNLFSYMVTGNTFLGQFDNVAFSNGQIGFQGSIRATAIEYDELANVLKAALQVI